ncbi:MAG: hypothetical protein LBP83_09395 [Dysgonamonadaceae bacterium]|jgi:hypothetical protein|nr:hypothetical protein [Dysgonamonadaceae bacterium]
MSAFIFTACLERDNPLDTNGIEALAKIEFDSCEVYDANNNGCTGNGDGIINKGETVCLTVYLKNTGACDARSVKAFFSTESAFISNFIPNTGCEYGTIAKNSKMYGKGVYPYYTIRFTVSTSTPDNTVIPVKIKISDENQLVWEDRFTVKVENTGANLQFSYQETYQSNTRISVLVKVENTGTSRTDGIKVTFTSESQYVTNFPATQYYCGSINANDYYHIQGGYSAGTFSINLANNTPVGTVIPINILAKDLYTNEWSDSFYLVYRD